MADKVSQMASQDEPEHTQTFVSSNALKQQNKNNNNSGQKFNIEKVQNVQNEILFVGALYKKPDLFVEYGQYIKSKYDFNDDATRFFYDAAYTIYYKRSVIFNKVVVTSFMTEDAQRLSQFKKYGGMNTLSQWMRLAETDNFQTYYDVLKKYSLLREYARNGYDVQKIIELEQFDLLDCQAIYQLIRGQVDRIRTVIMQNSDVEVLNRGLVDLVNEKLDVPDMGVLCPYPIMNELFRGLKTGNTMAVGMLSNAGKSRFMFKMIAYLAFVQHQKVMVLLNEMTITQMKLCLLVTVINNKEFQSLFGSHITKREREIALGLYRGEDDEFITRKRDEEGNCIESREDYINRLLEKSPEYRTIAGIANWVDTQTDELIYAKDVSTAYDDKSLEFEIRKGNLTNGIQYFFYDTLKDVTGRIGEWSGLKITTTKLSEIAKNLDVFIYCSIQLTDDTNYIRPDELTSSNISNCKQLKYVLDSLMLFKEIPKDDFNRYGYIDVIDDWGEAAVQDLNKDKRYYIGTVDKNRAGEKKKIVFELDLNTNEWYEVGELVRKR